MSIYFTRQSAIRTAALRRTYKRNHVAEKFLRRLYELGALDHIRSRVKMEEIIKGNVPKGFDIHHIIPLSGGGNNSLNNLCLIEASFHKFLNKYCFDPALKDIQQGETVEINVPDLPPVALKKDFMPFIRDTMNKRSKNSGFKKTLIAPLKKLPSFVNWKK